MRPILNRSGNNSRGVLPGALFCLAALLAGCTGSEHGRFTREAAEKAKQGKSEMTAAAAYETARQRFAAGDLEEAYRQINASLAINGTVADTLLLRVRILVEMGNDQPALEAAVAAGLKQVPHDARFNYYLGLFHERQGNTASAQENFLAATRLDGSSVQYKLAAAEMMIEQSAFAQAEEYLKQAVKEHPNSPGLLQTKGFLARINGDDRQAAVHFSEALALAPEQTVLRENLAVVSYSLGEYYKALSLLEPLLADRGYTGRRDLQAMTAECYLKVRRPVDARRLLQNMLRSEGEDSFELWRQLSDAAVMLDDLNLLHEAARKMTQLMPAQENGPLALAYYHQKRGDRAEAARVLEAYCGRSGNASAMLNEYLASLKN